MAPPAFGERCTRLKSLKECIDVLVTSAGRNGNLALNTGPMRDGRIESRQAERFG